MQYFVKYFNYFELGIIKIYTNFRGLIKVEHEFLAKVIGKQNLLNYTYSYQDILLEMLTMELVYDIIYGNLSRIRLINEGESFNLNQTSRGEMYAVLLVIVDNFWEICVDMNNRERYVIKRKILRSIIDSLTGKFSFLSTSLVGTDKLVVLLDHSDQEGDSLLASKDAAYKIQENILSNTEYSVTIAVSSNYSSITDLWKGYEESFKLMDKSFFYSANHIISKDMVSAGHFDEDALEAFEYRLFQNLTAGDLRNTLKTFRSMCSWIPTLSHIKDYNIIKSEVTKLYFKIATFFLDLGINAESVNTYLTQVVSDTISASKIVQIESSGVCFIEKLHAASSSSGSDELQVSFDRITAFAKEFYYRDIRVDEMAQMINISTSYFCRKFKQFHGVTFVSYLNDIRLKESRELLEKTSMSITNISLKVGFRDITYFSRTFKEKFGASPSFFRR